MLVFPSYLEAFSTLYHIFGTSTSMHMFQLYYRLFNSRLYNRYNANIFPDHHDGINEGLLSDTESMCSELELIMHLDADGLGYEEEHEYDSIDEDYCQEDDATLPLSTEMVVAMLAVVFFGSEDD